MKAVVLRLQALVRCFFSSRRRHTRLQGDWSSDVCSSDLHNLIAISNVGAFLVAAASAPRLEVGVELIGTPAEENGGGKIDLLRKGIFDRIVAEIGRAAGRERG